MRFCRYVSTLFAFVVLGLVSSVLSQEIGLEERLQSDLFRVEWDVIPELNRSLSHGTLLVVVAGVVARCRGDARIQDAVAQRSSFHHSSLLAVQSRLGLAGPHPGPVHGYHHALRRRLLAQRRRPRPQGLPLHQQHGYL